MNRQKVLLGVLSGIIFLAIALFIYYKLDKEEKSAMESKPMIEKKEDPRPMPDTIEGVTAEIQRQAVLDEAAFSEEAAAEEAEIKSDSESLNNLSESYDEDSL